MDPIKTHKRINRQNRMEDLKNIGFSRGGVHKNPKNDKRTIRREARRQERDY